MNAPGKRAWITRGAAIRLGVLGILLLLFLIGSWWTMIRMPGKSYRGPLDPLTDEQVMLRDALKRDVEALGGRIGERNLYRYAQLMETVEFLERSLAEAGYEIQRQEFVVEGNTCLNLAGEVTGSEEIIVVGAHYDTVFGSPGANDNGTGVAATLALARAMHRETPARTIRFVLFVNEEPPWFRTPDMGSRVYARRCAERGEKVVAMLSLETIGYFADDKGSQRYPPPFNLVYPSTGNFIAFVGNYSSRKLVRASVGAFRRHARFPSEGGAVPSLIPGVGWSDHWSFWQEGFPALMVTDTAPFRYPHYHQADDTPDKIDYDRMCRVVTGLEGVVRDLAQ